MLYTLILAMTPLQIPQRWMIAGLGIVVVLVGLFVFFGERGMVHIWHLAEGKRKLDEANFLLQEENNALRRKIQRLRHDDLYLEKVAREELGLARPGEIVYRFAPKGTPTASGSSPEPRRSSAQKARP